MTIKRFLTIPALIGIILSSCSTPSTSPSQPEPALQLHTPPAGPAAESISISPTPLPTRPPYKPGELVDYTAQTGDTLPALAARFNTTVSEIRSANPIIPPDATTMPPGLPMKIPIYFKSLWANPYKIIPDSAFVNGPALIGFNTSAFVEAHPGWLKNYSAYTSTGGRKSGGELIDYVATNYSVSPRLLLALLEYQSGALSNPEQPSTSFVLGYKQTYYSTVYLQLVLAANTLNNGYYGWRGGTMTEFYQPNGTIILPDPWQNAGSVGIQYFFSRFEQGGNYDKVVGPDGFYKTYKELFGDPWADTTVLIPGNLRQPAMLFPFPAGQTWTYTGGPHTGWGVGAPLSAVDFAPPSEFHGCFAVAPQNYGVAVANGLVIRSDEDGVVLDLDGDGNERTGWVVFYLHLAPNDRAPLGKELHSGDLIGYPSCVGGEATGTHIHIARKYNGEWILADGPLAFNLEGWVTHNGSMAYQGTLTRSGLMVKACQCSDAYSQIQSDPNP